MPMTRLQRQAVADLAGARTLQEQELATLTLRFLLLQEQGSGARGEPEPSAPRTWPEPSAPPLEDPWVPPPHGVNSLD